MVVLPRCTHRHRLLFAIAALSIAILHPASAAETNTLSPQAIKDFEWFSTLGFPDLKGCPYVRVATGFWSKNYATDDPPQQDGFNAFLLATNSGGFRVFTLDLAERSFSLTNPITEGNTRPAFEAFQLTNEVAKWQSEVFTLAWACWRNGLDADAQRLYEQAQKTRSRNGGLGGAKDLRATLENDVGSDMFHRGLTAFGNTAIPRTQLLAQFESILTNYPRSQYVDRATHFAEVLKRMVSEDQAHAELAVTNLDQLPVEQQVRELVFRLRDQEGAQNSNPGKCSVFTNRRQATNTPAHQLLRLGYAAVPQLIAALDDTNYSRAVGGGMMLTDVLTVGDCALQILEEIAGTTFFQSRVASYLSMSGDKQTPNGDALSIRLHGGTDNLPPNGDLASTRKAAQSWWAAVQQKGEKQVLIDAVTSAGQDAPAQAEMLCQRYPDIAAATIIRGVVAATNWWVHARFVEIISKLDEPQVADFLSHEMSSAPTADDRERAAYYLRDKRPAEALQAMLHDWETNGDTATVSFLADSDSVPAIQALERGLRQHPIATRYSVIRSIGDTNGWTHHKCSQGTLDAIEECLIIALDDTEVRTGTTQVTQSRILRTLYDVRICDLAAFFLAQRWPDRYVFDLSPGLSTRERQRVECQNVWRRAHNLPLLPLPPTAKQLKPEQANKVTSIEWATDSAKPGADFTARIEAFRDKLLDTNHLVAFLSALGTNPEPQCSGIEFKAVKDDDLTGVKFTIRLLPGTPPDSGRQSWNFDRRITLGRKTLERTGGSDIAGKYSRAGSSGWFPDTLSKILAADPETPFEIWFQLKALEPQPKVVPQNSR